jgi:hypothetical protein
MNFGIFAAIIVVRVIVMLVQSQSAVPRGRMEDAGPQENHIPQRPQLGGYGVAAPEEPDAR